MHPTRWLKENEKQKQRCFEFEIMTSKAHLCAMQHFDQTSWISFPNIQWMSFRTSATNIVPIIWYTNCFPRSLNNIGIRLAYNFQQLTYTSGSYFIYHAQNWNAKHSIYSKPHPAGQIHCISTHFGFFFHYRNWFKDPLSDWKTS